MVKLTNGVVDAVIANAFGPRVLSYRFIHGTNVLAEVPALSTPIPGGVWRPRGGHRLWVAPEHLPGSYAPDDDPVDTETDGPLAATFRQGTDAAGIEKQINVRLAAAGTGMVLTHTIINRTPWPIRVAPWAITIVASAATAVIPQPPYRSHDDDLLPAQALVQWSFTDLTDPRWSIGKRLIQLTPDPARTEPQKIGVGNARGWCALITASVVFIKQFGWDPQADYPDLGSNNEVYTAGDYLEMETLAPLRVLAPGGSATHVERWSLAEAVDVPAAEAERAEWLERLVAE